jgi:hypothetical protein
LLLSITIDTSTPPSLAFIHILGFLEGEGGGGRGDGEEEEEEEERAGRRGGKKNPADFNSQPKSQ